MVRVQELTKDFGRRRAVDAVSFQVEPGTVLGFLGPNGAGKTTTMRMITGYLRPTSGRAEVNGHDVHHQSIAARSQIGYLPENAPLYEEMTVTEFLCFVAEMRGFTGRQREERVGGVIERCLLDAVRYQTVDTLSKGYRQRTVFAQALIHDPPVLILDEPTEGLDPNQKKVVRNMIREMGKQKVIILSTHVLEEVEAMCSRVIIISNGTLVADDSPAKLKEQSAYYNVLTIEVNAPEDQARAALGRLADVHRELIGGDGKSRTFRLIPRNGRPLAGSVLELARREHWAITNLRTDGGRLDDVFRRLTTTEDVDV